MKRLCVISFHTCPLSDEKNADTGGMKTYVLELSQALAQKGIAVDIFTRCVDRNSCNIIEVQPNLRIIHLKAGETKIVPKNKLPGLIPKFTKELQQFIKKGSLSYGLASSHYWLSGLVGLEIKRTYQIPLYITFHTLALLKNLVGRGGEKESLERIKAEFKLVKQADKVIATSPSDLKYIQSLYNCPFDKLTQISPGVDLELFKPQKQKKDNVILFVGRIAPLKGIDALLYALKILVSQDPKKAPKLWIIGEGDTRYLKKVVKLLNLADFVFFLGKKKHEELPHYYNAAKVVMMPSLYESFGLAALEAMSCGIPVIITDVAGISNLLGKKHRPLLTSASNPILLASKIKNLLTNKAEHKLMSQEVFEKVQSLSWENTADNFIKSLLFR